MNRKRGAPSGDASSATKRIKLLNSNAPLATDEQKEVQRVGLKLINNLNNATDKTGRSIIGAFLALPSREELPDYYDQTKLPVALDTIEEKLKRHAYPTVTMVESDFKRMIQNAKDYNIPKSEVYEDAERIRKLVYNFMKVHNPQYKTDPAYSSFPTPLPLTDEPTATSGADVKRETQSRDGSAKFRQSMAPRGSEAPSEEKSSLGPDGSPEGDDEDDDMDFTNKTFQEAQQMIVAECLRYADDEGLEVFTPFANLPSRKLDDYYKAIKHPVSLKGVQKRIRGQHGRNPPTGVTDFKTWDAFEEEVSHIWSNAREYNEDGSDMYDLAGEFEEHFKLRLAEAKEKVEEPTGPRIKLGAPKPKSGITLNLTQHRNSPAPGVTVDNDALARQRQLVQAGANGPQVQPRPAPMVNGNGSFHVPLTNGRPALSAAPVNSSPAPVVKSEKLLPMPSPAPLLLPHTNGMLPPPLVRPPSGSPFPGQQNTLLNSFHYTAPAALPPIQLRDYPASQALLPVVTLATHPQLRIAKPYHLSIPPHDTLSHQSTTITLPSTHYFLQISPTISRELSMGRAYKMFVTVNGTRLTQRDTQFHADSGKRTHVYEGSLASGVNRVEIEVAAAKFNGKGLDVEKVTVFANLLRAA